MKRPGLQNAPVDELVNKFIEFGLDHFLAVEYPEKPSKLQLQLYLRTPKEFNFKNKAIEVSTVTPFDKDFWSKPFWREKKSWNPFSKEFWRLGKKKIFLEKLAPEGKRRFTAQIVNTVKAREQINSMLLDLRLFEHFAAFDVPVIDRPPGTKIGPTPAYLIINPKTEEGEKLVLHLFKTLKERGFKESNPFASVAKSIKDVSGENVAPLFVPEKFEGKPKVH